MENNQEIKPESVELSSQEIEEMWAKARASMQGHHWIQRGTVVSCETCPFHHSFYLQPGYILKGIDDDGKPILDRISGLE